MVVWRHGSWTGSVKRWARDEVRRHLRNNATARRVRYGLAHRALRRFLGFGTFGRFVGAYVALDVAFIGAEALVSRFETNRSVVRALLAASQMTDQTTLLRDIFGIFITAQVGVLALITLALALVTLIAQRENSETDIKVYYHESMAFEVVASCLGLLAVLVVQFTWPLQGVLHRVGFGVDNLLFEFVLHGIHLAWLLVNLLAVAYFIRTTFQFVQQSARMLLRARYTRNVVLPRELASRLCEARYSAYSVKDNNVGDNDERCKPSVTFGFDCGEPYVTELERTFARPSALRDVRLKMVEWVFRRWSERCRKSEERSSIEESRRTRPEPIIWFTPRMNVMMSGTVGWCRRRGGVPLTRLEKCVLRYSFIFSRRGHAV